MAVRVVARTFHDDAREDVLNTGALHFKAYDACLLGYDIPVFFRFHHRIAGRSQAKVNLNCRRVIALLEADTRH